MPDSMETPDRFFVRSRGGATIWLPFVPVPAEIEVDIRRLVLESPEFLSTEAGQVFRAAMPAGTEGTDRALIAVDDAGGIVITTCIENAEPHDVVTGVLTAGATLWRRQYADFCADFRARTGSELEKSVADRVGTAWSVERFREAIQNTLNRGQFPILLLSDGLKPAPNEVIVYLQSMNLTVTTFSYMTCRCGEVELVLPGRTAAEDRIQDAEVRTAAVAPKPSVAKPEPATQPQARQEPTAVHAQAPQTVPQPGRTSQPPVDRPPVGTPATEERLDDIVPPDFAWARAGTKPGVMADKRPPPESKTAGHPAAPSDSRQKKGKGK